MPAKTHGRSYTKEYYIWRSIKARCLNKNTKQYNDYGGRGITICEEWKNNFAKFFADMGECKRGYTIERQDNEKGYSYDNCKWVSRHENNRNKRNNIHITYKGETKILRDWAKELGIKYTSLKARIDYLGWSVEKAFETPTEKDKNFCRKGHDLRQVGFMTYSSGERRCKECQRIYDYNRRGQFRIKANEHIASCS